jgi:hypothetical protein
MKTAVEWLEWQLGAYINGNIHELTFEEFLFLVGIAKEMEKEQLRKSYEKGKKYKKPLKDSNPIK